MAGVAIALPIVLVIAVFVWACTALRPDLSPPDPSSVPPAVLAVLRLEVGDSVAGAASRFLIDTDPPIPQLRYSLAGILGSVWIRYTTSDDQALARIALESHFGHGFFGIDAASRGYLGTPADALTPSQAAALVAITRGGNGYSPWCHPDRLAKRITALQQDPARALEGLLPPAPDACSSK
ncbi:MAG: transglycosylase domain-containing protein [Myxococcota bacterium]